jgi:tRNA(Ile)-lysidine synthase
LLAIRRQALRDLLTLRGMVWIEDPANHDQRSLRARARIALSQTSSTQAPEAAPRSARTWDGGAWSERHGALTLSRRAVRTIPASEIAAACVCAAGAQRPPRPDAVAALAARLAGEESFVATLAGARIEATPENVIFGREPGEWIRTPPAPQTLKAGETAVWDGRFEVTAADALTLRPLAGLAGRLARRDRTSLAVLPPAVRRGLPAATDDCDKVSCLALPGGPASARSLVWPRLAAFCGAFDGEAALSLPGGSNPSHSEKACG